MGNVKDFPTQRNPLEMIAKELVEDKKTIRTAVIVTRAKNGDLTIQCYSPDSNVDDILAIEKVVADFSAAVWRNGFES